MRVGIAAKIIAAVAIPAVGFIGFAAAYISEHWRTAREIASTEQAFVYAVSASTLVHELQKERGASALFIGARGAQFVPELRTQRSETDKAFAAFRQALEPLRQASSLREVAALGVKARQEVEAVPARRSQIDALTLPGPQSFAGYTATIRSLLASMHGLGAVTQQPELIAALGTYLAFLEGKEKAGQERATGSGAFAAKRFEPEIYQRFVGLGLTQEADFAAFQQDATPGQVAYFRQLQQHPSFAEVQRLRKIGYDFYATGNTGDVAGPYWFQATTQRIDQLKLLEDRLSADLQALCAQMRTGEQSQLVVIGMIVAGLLLLAGLLSSLIIRGITVPLAGVVRAMTRLAAGDTDVAVQHKPRRDQIGDLVAAYESFRDNAREKQRLESEATVARETSDRRRGEREVRELTAAAEIEALVDSILSGNLTMRLDEGGKEGLFLDVTRRLNQLANMLQDIVGNLARVTSALADGDLTQSLQGDYTGVFGQLRDSANRMAVRLQDFAGKLSESADAVYSGANEISSGSQDLAQRTESQAASIEQTAASMHEITATVKQNADNAQAASQLAVAARDMAEKGGGVVAEAVTAVTRIEGSARKISDIVGLIDEIAFQTNLLALNASVEAARAGEAGKGFAVVAQEVRALAQRSANASKDIKALITESNGQVRAGAGLVNQTGQSLSEIVTAIKKVSDLVAEIAAASREQATGLDQVNTAVGSMDEITQRNGALVEETSASAQALAGQGRQLSELVQFFRRA